MHLSRVAILASLVLAGATKVAAAQVYEGPAARRAEVFWSPADRFWTGGVAPRSCLRSGRKGPFPSAPRLQAAVYEQRGELIGEVRSTPAMAPKVVAQAQSCANEADSATTTYALLTDAERNWGVFRNAFSACLTRNNTAQYVGSMTLWIDQACNW
jgi:hypothetical protein